MKKIIAAAAGLMIAGSAFATVATAAVEFSGDARARYYYQDKFQDNLVDQWNNRVRLKVKATTAGGSYMETRFRVANEQWGANGGIGDNAGYDITADYAFIGVPLGCIELTAGRQPLSISPAYFNDASLDNVRVKYDQNGTTLVAYYGVINNYDTTVIGSIYDHAGTAIVDEDGDDLEVTETTLSDSEDQLWGALWGQDWDGNWKTQVGVSYYNYDLADADNDVNNGFVSMASVGGNVADMVDLYVELGFQQKGVDATDNNASNVDVDDAFGGFMTAGMTFDAFTPTLVAGYADEGFVYDAAVGFMFIGGDGQLSLIDNIGGAETWFVGLTTGYQATENLGFTMNLAYIDWESTADSAVADFEYYEQDNNGFEVSLQAAYTVNDGTVLYARAGMLALDDNYDVDSEEDTAYGAGLSLELSF